MSIALVASAGGNGAAKVATSAAMNTTGATLLVAIGATYGGSDYGLTFSDNKSNANWTKLTKRFNAAYNPQMQIAYCYGLSSVGSSHTVSVEGDAYSNDGYLTIAVLAFSGTLTTSAVFNVEAGAVVSAATTSVETGSLTPSVGDVLVCGLGWYQGSASLSDSIAIQVTQAYQVASYINHAMAYRIDPGASAINPTWTVGNTDWAKPVVAACFKSDGVVGEETGHPAAKRFGAIPFVGQCNAGLARW